MMVLVKKKTWFRCITGLFFFDLDQRATVPLPRQSTKRNWIQAPDKFTAQSQPCSATSAHCWLRDWLDEQLQRSFLRAWKTFPGSELDRTICTCATSTPPSKAFCSTSRKAAGTTLPWHTSHTIISRGDHFFLPEENTILYDSVSHCQERKDSSLT